jgi:hypothetical protein
MTHEELTVTVDPVKEPQAYPIWEFDPPRALRKVTHKEEKWCWTAHIAGLPDDLQRKFDTYHVEDVWNIIAANPAYFFYGADRDHILWECPHQPDETRPTCSGIDTLGNIHIAEVIWYETRNIDERIKKLAYSYAPKYMAGKLNPRKPGETKLTCHIVFPGAISQQCITNLVSCAEPVGAQWPTPWQAVHLRFGLLQVGWRAANPKAHLLRVYWFNGSDWDDTTQDFCDHNAHLVPLSWQP